ncbi:MAG: metallophosphoesterase [Deltaproteobacteria bacterium]|nr:MAG: metallophosphoesterase [Deltaproteobacteria bacterium]
MNILHISDIHFGPRHWEGDDHILLKEINAYDADIVINTGDSTTDGMEDEYAEAGRFLKAIECKNVISIMGNHDKRNMRSHELFLKYIFDPKIIYLSEMTQTTKKNLFLNREITRVRDNFTDVNFIKVIPVNGKSVLIVGIDSNELYTDVGLVEEEILHAISDKINQMEYDLPLLLIHHSILGTDEEPLKNSIRVSDFVRKHKIENVFCGHTHEMELRRTTDLYHGHSFTQFMCGTLSSCNHANDDNMFLCYENWDTDDQLVHLVRISIQGGKMHFEREYI